MHKDINVNVSGPVQPTSTYKTKVLKGQVPFATQVTEPNMKYVIKHNFDLGGGSVTIPEGCLLEFDGGAISNGILVGQSTILIYNQPLNDILTATLEGTWKHEASAKADEEDITDLNGELKFKDKTYAPTNYSGLGRKILRKSIVSGVNTLTQSMMSDTNTIYHIQYDFDLNEQTITIPANCVLEFDGGSLSNGTLNGKTTKINATVTKIFGSNIDFSGTWDIPDIYPEWFGAKGDGTTDNSDAFQKCFNNTEILGSHIRVTGKVYKFLTTITTVRLIDLDIDKGVVLKYYGNDNFVNVGRSQDNQKMGGVIRGGRWEMENRNTGDVFHIIWAIHLRFVDVTALYGATSFNTNHSDLKGAWYCYFIDCYAQATGDACFNMRPYTGKQNNQIQFIRCNAKVATNGFVIGGTAISMIGCCAEACGSYGVYVPDDVVVRGFSIDTLYSEGNPDGPVYIGRYSGNYPKKDVSINSIYDLSGKRCVVNMGDTDIINNNIYYDDLYIRQRQFSQKKDVSISNIPNWQIMSKIMCVKLPAIVSYRNNAPNTGIAALGLLIGNRVYLVYVPNLTCTIARRVSQIDNYVITLNQAVPDDFVVNSCSIIGPEHPLYFLSKDTLEKYPLIIREQNGKGAADDFALADSALGQDRISFTMTENMKSRVKIINVGDIVYFKKSTAQISWNILSMTTGTAVKKAEIPSVLRSHPLFDRFVIGNFSTGATSTDVSFDYIDISTIEGVPCTGTFADKPVAADIYEGFKYFCTDKQSAEGATDGIEIIHKGNDVWVDALGRVVS